MSLFAESPPYLDKIEEFALGMSFTLVVEAIKEEVNGDVEPREGLAFGQG